MNIPLRQAIAAFVFVLIIATPYTSLDAAVPTISEEKQTLIAALLAKIAELQKQLQELNTAAEAPALLVEPLQNPPARLLVAADQLVEFTKVKLTAQGKDVTLKGLTIMQTGMANDAVFSYLGIVEDLASVTAPKTDHTYKLTLKKPITIKRGESQEITLYGAMAYDLSSYDGQLARLSLAALDADAPVQGTLPIAGTFMTVNSNYAIGELTATAGAFDPLTNKNITLNSTAVIFSGVRLTLSASEAIKLSSIAWRQGGSASGADVKNLKTVVVYGGETRQFDALPREDDIRFYDSSLGDDGIRINKGDSFEIYIQGDVGLGVNRTIDFDIDANTDIWAIGVSSSASIAPQIADVSGVSAAEGQTSDLSYPFYNGYAHTIAGPVSSVSKAN